MSGTPPDKPGRPPPKPVLGGLRTRADARPGDTSTGSAPRAPAKPITSVKVSARRQSVSLSAAPPKPRERVTFAGLGIAPLPLASCAPAKPVRTAPPSAAERAPSVLPPLPTPSRGLSQASSPRTQPAANQASSSQTTHALSNAKQAPFAAAPAEARPELKLFVERLKRFHRPWLGLSAAGLTTLCLAVWAASVLSPGTTATADDRNSDPVRSLSEPRPAGTTPVAGQLHEAAASETLSQVLDPGLLDGSTLDGPSCDETLGHEQVEPTDDEAAIAQSRDQGDRAMLAGNVAAARVAYCRAVALDPGNFGATYSLARALLIARDANAAERWARDAAELPSEQKQLAVELRGDALVRLGRTEAARQLWLAAAGVPGASKEALDDYLLKLKISAARAFNRHDYHRAESLYRRVLAFDTKHEVSRRRLVATLIRLKEHSAAEFWTK